MSAEDDRALMERLAALEAEVKADADAQRARKEAALARAREQRAEQLAEREELRARQAALVSRKQGRAGAAEARGDDDDDDDGGGLLGRRGGRGGRGDDRRDDLGDALALARKAQGVKAELSRPARAGEKSWIKSGIASAALGPIGWLYAGSLREAVPASAAWVALALLASKILPMLLLMPALMVALPLSGLAGVVYALQYNRTGKRQRLFGNEKPKKQLPRGD